MTVSYGSRQGRWVLLATVLGSSMGMLDGTIVNVALPTIGRELDASLTELQWTVNAYALTLAGLLLLGGSLADHFGRRRIFIAGVLWFAAGSLACGLAPTAEALIAARAFQGIGAALLTPGSLAIIQSSFERDGRAAAIGAWSGLAGVSVAIGPLLGGALVELVSWRLIFFINLPLAALVVWVAIRHVPESRDERVRGAPLDLTGAALSAIGLAALTYALMQGPIESQDAASLIPAVCGAALLAGFLVRELRTAHPMVPPGLFASRRFSGTNAATFLIYAALAAALFVLPIQLQVSSGFSVVAAGAAVIPMTLIMLVFSARAGRLAERIGPRLPMTAGAAVAGLGLILLVRVDADATFTGHVLPAVTVLGAGMALAVAPLTATVLAAAGEGRAGVASAVNNAVARVGGLLAVAVVPAASGLSGDDYEDAAAFTAGFEIAVVACGVLCLGGAVIAWVTVGRRPRPLSPTAAHCPLDAPPLRAEPRNTVPQG